MARHHEGIRIVKNRRQAYIKINGRTYTKLFPLDKPLEDLRQWREDRLKEFGGGAAAPASGSFAGDVKTYLGRITSMTTYKQKAAHLELWLHELGRDRPRRTVSSGEVTLVIDRWLGTGLDPQTVRKRRTALQSLFVELDGKAASNPARGVAAKRLKPPKTEARFLTYAAIARILAHMPARLSAKRGTDRGPSLARVRSTVIAYTGIPPGMLGQVTESDLNLRAATVRGLARLKGGGVEPRTLDLTALGLDAFKAFHAANAYGPFAVESVNRAFKKAAKRAGFDPRAVHLYDLRHSFGTELYAQTKDLATVGRFLCHAEGSTVTARYAKGANRQVDRAAALAFAVGVRQQQRDAMTVTPRAKGRPRAKGQRKAS